MRHKLMLMVIVGACCLGAAFPRASFATAERSTFLYLALGDSVAYGVGAIELGQSGYADRLAGHFRAAKHGGVDEYVNLSVPGETTASLISGGQLERAIAVIDEPANIRVVTLTIGGNDLRALLAGADAACVPATKPGCAGAVQQTLATFASNYSAILGALHRAFDNDPGNESLLVMTYYNPFTGVVQRYPSVFGALKVVTDQALLGVDGQIDCGTAGLAVGLNDLITCIGEEYGATPIDVYPTFAANPTLVSADLIHPTPDGHTAIATLFQAGYKQHGFDP